MWAPGLRSVGPILALLVAIAASDARAQSYQGSVSGAVRDVTGVAPGAHVVLVNEETNTARMTTTNAAGEYAFPNVPPGAYTIKAALAGFKTFESRGISIGTQDSLVDDDDVVETLATNGTDHALDVGILPRTRLCGEDFLDAHACDSSSEAIPIDGVPIP